MTRNDQIYESIENIIGSNNAGDNINIRFDQFEILTSEAIRTVYEIEKILGPNITYDDARRYATKVAMVFPNTTSDQYVTQVAEDLNRLKYYVEGISLTAIAIVGLLVNTLSIVILTSKEMRNSFNLHLAALAGYDMLTLFTAILIFGLPTISVQYRTTLFPWILPIGFGFAHIGRVGSVFATLIVTIERFIAVVYPLRKLQKNQQLLSICLFGSVVYNIPRFLEFETTCIYVDENKIQIPNITNSTYSGSNITKILMLLQQAFV